MAYVQVPKDLANVKTKVIFHLTKRQLICFSIAAFLGIPIFLLTRDYIGSSNAMLIMMIVMFPMFMFAMYEKNTQPLEVILKNYIEVKFIKPKYRPYKTKNYYDLLEKQMNLEREVEQIVRKRKDSTDKSRKKRN